MAEATNPENKQGTISKDAYRAEIMRLRQPGALQQKIAQFDKVRPFRRLFVMGCGRSGTWLLAAVMSTFAGVELIPEELSVEHFGMLRTDQSMLVLKRDFTSYRGIEEIPDEIEIVYILRNPFDVLTSYNPATKSPYHVPPERWLGEMLALQYLVDTNRPRTKIVRYEDLVTQPHAVQSDLAAFFGLTIGSSTDDIDSTFKASPETAAAMHGIRKIDANSIGKHKNDPAKLDYLKRIRPRLGRVLQWVGETYHYDITL